MSHSAVTKKCIDICPLLTLRKMSHFTLLSANRPSGYLAPCCHVLFLSISLEPLRCGPISDVLDEQFNCGAGETNAHRKVQVNNMNSK